MGYYAAGGAAALAWSPPNWTQPLPSYPQGQGPLTGLPAYGSSASSAPSLVTDLPYRKRRQVIDLTALRRAERRIDRATRIFSRLYSKKKTGHHGFHLKHKRRRK